MTISVKGGPPSVKALTKQMQGLQLKNRIKAVSPKRFSGDRSQMRPFVTQARLYFLLKPGIQDSRKGLLLASLLEGPVY
jgi:hypothetical protein